MTDGTWARLGLGKRIAVVAAAAVVGLNVVLFAVDSLTGGAGPGGPRSSSYATDGQGVAAYADLLDLRGVPVGRIRRPLDAAQLRPGETLVMADPDRLEQDDAEAVLAFAQRGGRLVLLGESTTPLLAPVAGGEVGWEDGGPPTARPVAGAPEAAGVTVVRTGRSGRYRELGRLRPLLRGTADGGDAVVAATAPFGAGEVVAVADSAIVTNERLAQADNASFALGLVGDDRPVRFAEVVHGYGRATGLGALPSRWRWAAAGLAVAALIGMWASGQRFGPPEDRRRRLAPARREHVDAVAAALARTNRPDAAVEPLRAAVRRAALARTGLGPEATDAQLLDAAAATGLSRTDLETALAPADGDRQLVAMGAAASRLTAADRHGGR